MKENYLKKELYDLIKNNSKIFDFIQSGSLDGIWYWDLEKPENEWMSSKFWETLGYDPKKMKHKSDEWQDIIFKEDLETAIDNFNKHCKDPNYPYDQIVRYKHKTGRTIWIRCRGLAVRDKNGIPVRMIGAHTDITELKETEMKLSRIKNEYEKVFNGTKDAMFLIRVLDGNKFRYIRNNLAHQEKTGITFGQIRNKTPEELLGKKMADIVSANYKKCINRKKSIEYEETLNLPAGERIWYTTLTPIFRDGEISYIVGSSRDITERKILEKKLEKNANYDKLTGLPNRRLFFEMFEQIIYEAERYDNKFALLFIDLDGFKDINDNFGHEIGDEVLILSGNRLKNIIRKSDFIARMGGDEFIIILRNIDNKNIIEKVVKKIHNELKREMKIKDIHCKVNSSIGVAVYPENGENSEKLLKNSDLAMYEIKKNGKGGFKFFDDL